MVKYTFKFASIPYEDPDVSRVRAVVRKLCDLKLFRQSIVAKGSVEKDESGRCIAVLELKRTSDQMLLALLDAFEDEGLPRPTAE